MDYKRKIDFAINLLRNIPQDGMIEISYSGGKDSDVILELAKMAGIKYEAIYKNTTIDPPGTIAHAKEMGAKVLQPKRSFLDIVRSKGFPSRFSRFCCSELKEYKVHNRAVQGIRRSESTKRAERYKEPELCRTYRKGEKVRVYLPILEWGNEDVERFVLERGIKCAPVYYDEQGNFCVERRLGCIGCPLASPTTRKQQYMANPRMLRAQMNALKCFYDTHPEAVGTKMFGGDVYKKFASDLFFAREPKEIIQTGLFPMPDAKQFLEQYFKTDLTINDYGRSIQKD